ncbi:MAG: DUF2844 domain-containing protein [Leptospirillia bacterium]
MEPPLLHKRLHRPGGPLLLTALLLAFLLSPHTARAALGEVFSSKELASLHYSSLATTQKTGGITLYTLSRTRKSPLGRADLTERLREVAGPDGRIFALSWSGVHHPNLRRLLGGRLPSPLPFVRGARILSTPTLELRMGGSVIHSEGTAWDPRLLPPGADLSTLLELP